MTSKCQDVLMYLRQLPGSRGLSQAPSPLRTVLDSFPSYGSSPSEGLTYCDSRPEGTRDFPIVIDCQYSRSLKGAPSRIVGTLFAFPYETDSFYFLVTRHLPIISLLTEPRIFSVSLTLQQGIRLPKASHPRPPTACLTVSLPRGRRHWGSMFRINDPNLTT